MCEDDGGREMPGVVGSELGLGEGEGEEQAKRERNRWDAETENNWSGERVRSRYCTVPLGD